MRRRYNGVMPALDASPSVVEVTLPDRSATRRLAARLARRARPGDVIGLVGALGAGKTTLARGFIEALAGGEREVPSPTFTLVQTYECDIATIWHFDLFRITRPEDVIELGFDDALGDGITLIEWPERLGPLLPADRLDVTLTQGAAPEARVARIAAHGALAARLTGIADDSD